MRDRLVAARLAPPPQLSPRPVEVCVPDTLLASRLLLRPLRSGDREAVVEMLDRNADDLARWLNVHKIEESGRESSETCFERLLDATCEGDARGSDWRRVVCLHDGTPIGMVHVLAIDRALEAKGDVGWWIDREHRRQGYATEALALLTRHALRDCPSGLGLLRLVAAITPDNLESKGVAVRCGYQRDEGSTCGILVGGVWKTHELWHADAPEAPL